MRLLQAETDTDCVKDGNKEGYMNNIVMIKGYKEGLTLQLDNLVDFDTLLRAVAQKFESSRSFFKDSSLALSVEGRWLSTEEEKALLQTIEQHSDINIICILGTDEQMERRFLKAVKRVESQRDDNNARFYMANVGPEELIECEGSLVVVGDVLEGGTVTASKDIVILGHLYGSAFAGVNDRNPHFIAAFGFNGQKVKIGDMLYHPIKKKSIIPQGKNSLKMVHIKNGVLAMDDYSGDILKNVTTI